MKQLLELHKYVELVQKFPEMEIRISASVHRATEDIVEQLLTEGIELRSVDKFDTFHCASMWYKGTNIGSIFTANDAENYNLKTENFFSKYVKEVEEDDRNSI